MEAWLHPRTATNVSGVLGIHQSHPQPLSCSHLVKCSGIEAAIMGLCRGLDGHHQLERGTHTCLGVVLNDERYIKNVEEWEAIRGGMGKVWRTWLRRKPGARKGIRTGGHEESSGPRIEERRGVKIEELSPLLTPKTHRPRPDW